MFIMNQMIASQLREIPHMKASDMTKGRSRLVKTLTEITACYVQLAQVEIWRIILLKEYTTESI